VTLTAVLGVSSIAPALPRLGDELQLSPQQTGLLITAFTVPGVLLTPVAGIVADRFGRRRALAPALWLFAGAGAACALADGFEQLLALRLLQGMGAAPLNSLNVTLVGDLFTGDERSRVMGYNGSVLSVGTASYPAMGGALAELGWRWPFLLSLLAIPVALAVHTVLKNPEPDGTQSLRDYFDSVGRSLRRRPVGGIFMVSTITFVLLYGSILTYFPVLLDRRFAMSPGVIGLYLSGASVATAVASSRMGRLAPRFGERRLVAAAFVLYAVALGAIPLLDSPWLLVAPVLLFGTAMGLNLPALLTVLASLAPRSHRGAFMSINGMVLRLGQTLGPVAAGMAFGWQGLSAPFYLSAGLAGLTLALAVPLVPRRSEGPPAA